MYTLLVFLVVSIIQKNQPYQYYPKEYKYQINESEKNMAY